MLRSRLRLVGFGGLAVTLTASSALSRVSATLTSFNWPLGS